MSKQQTKWPVIALIVGVVVLYLYNHQVFAKKPVIASVGPGTAIELRMDRTVSSKSSIAGQSFSGTLAKDILVDGTVVIPSGTEFSGKVIEATPVGRLAGGARLRVALTSFSLEGTAYPLHTAEVVRVSQGQGKRTAKLAGGGAVIGAAIGALAHKGKGAAIGAAVGATAGAAGSAATSEAHDVALPAESVLTFKLTDTLVVTPKPVAQGPHDLMATLRGLFS
ncbi:MAG TPA: hypothetical protein VKV39_12390 [Candidatus Sulfotelmatobacter sp.]|nr:hypothetical protein [Candidatus Sulfotelmatobacter sp.]